MNPALRTSRFLALPVLFAGLRLAAQEFTILPVGDMSRSEFQHSTFAWQVDYRLFATRYIVLSEAYLNEGKVPGHRRDGYATEVWANLPVDAGLFSLSGGAGIYNFYDTQVTPGGDSTDVHGMAPMVSLSATTYVYDRLYLRFMFNRIMPAHDIRVNTFEAGMGVWLGRGDRPVPIMSEGPVDKEIAPNEITVFYGQSTVNTLRNQTAAATGIEYRHGISSYLDAAVSWIYEGDPKIIRRNGIAAQLCPVNTFAIGDERIGVGIGLGAYGYIDRKGTPRPGQNSQTAVAFLVSPSLSWDFSEHWSVRIVLHRVVTSYNRDSDVFLVGLTHRWGQ